MGWPLPRCRPMVVIVFWTFLGPRLRTSEAKAVLTDLAVAVLNGIGRPPMDSSLRTSHVVPAWHPSLGWSAVVYLAATRVVANFEGTVPLTVMPLDRAVTMAYILAVDPKCWPTVPPYFWSTFQLTSVKATPESFLDLGNLVFCTIATTRPVPGSTMDAAPPMRSESPALLLSSLARGSALLPTGTRLVSSL